MMRSASHGDESALPSEPVLEPLPVPPVVVELPEDVPVEFPGEPEPPDGALHTAVTFQIVTHCSCVKPSACTSSFAIAYEFDPTSADASTDSSGICAGSMNVMLQVDVVPELVRDTDTLFTPGSASNDACSTVAAA